MLIRAKRPSIYHEDEAAKLKAALANVFRAPSDTVRRLSQRDIDRIETLNYTYEGLASAEHQLYHKVFTEKGLKSQVDFVTTPGGPRKLKANEFPKIDFN